MALSSSSYFGNGSNRLYAITFPYLAKSNVKVFVNGVEDTTFTFPTASSIQTTSTPSNGVIVFVQRVTPTIPLVDFVDGSTITESLLDTATLQALYVSEETKEAVTNLIGLDGLDNTYNALNKRIKNVANPVNAQDVATKQWSETAVTASVAQASASATSAASLASNASTSATNAANSATTSSTQAGISTTKAGEASTSAGQASTSAGNASTSASTATTQAGIATTKAGEALVSANNAATSYDSFDDRYLGTKSTNPTLDNDGLALLEGAIYWNTTDKRFLVWNSTAWVGASLGVTADGSITQVKLGSNVAGTGAAFSAYSSTSPSLATSTFTKVPFDAEEYDLTNAYDPTLRRFTPAVAGYYHITGVVRLAGTGVTDVIVSIYKNGVEALRCFEILRASDVVVYNAPFSAYFNMNTTDYIEIFAYISGSSGLQVIGGAPFTKFQGALVRAA